MAMRPDRRAGIAAAIAVVATALVACWGVLVRPTAWPRWLLSATILPAMWAFAEVVQERGRDESTGRAIMTLLRWCVAWTGLMLALSIALRLAMQAGLLSAAWQPVGRRLFGILLGIGMLLVGNALPKLRSPWPYPRQPFAWQQVHRFVGWTFVLAGLGVLGSWLFLSTAAASRATFQIMVITMVLSFGRKLASVVRVGSRSTAR